MSVSGISTTSFTSGDYSIQAQMQKARQDFSKLGQDLQAGDLSAAQSDFTTLQQDGPQSSNKTSSTTSTSGGAIGQDFNKLSQDLQSGNVTSAQQDYASLQKDFQSIPSGVHGHHHHHGGGGENAISQELNSMMQSLQSGDTSSAQQAYTSLQQTLQMFAQSNGLGASGSSTQSSSTQLSLTA